MSALSYPFALIGALATSFGTSRRYEHLFAMSETELKSREMDREGLVRSYITGLTHN